jgi:hypothetical protein
MQRRSLFIAACGLVLIALALVARDWVEQHRVDRFGHAPCAIPVHYRVAEVDPRFGFDLLTVTAALVEAVNLWQAATSTVLFIESDHPRAMQVSLLFDDRQQAANTRRSLRRGLERDRRALEADEQDLLHWSERIEAARQSQERASAELAARVRQHESELASWNAGTGARTEARRRAIEAERGALRAEVDELERRGQALNADIAAYNRRASDLRARAAEFQSRVASFNLTVSADPVESGRYSYDRLDGRRIDVFRVERYEDLVWVLAHELGHALGIGHVDFPGAIMHATLHEDGAGAPEAVRPAALSAADLAAMAIVCSASLR